MFGMVEMVSVITTRDPVASPISYPAECRPLSSLETKKALMRSRLPGLLNLERRCDQEEGR